jgi:hypothetical protein
MLFITRLCLLLMTAALILSYSTSSPALGEQRKRASDSATRVLSFPDDFSVGKIYLLFDWWEPGLSAYQNRAIRAKGKVLIKGKQQLMLDLAPDPTIKPEQLMNLPAKEFVYLSLEHTPLDDSYIKVINQFRSMSRLELTRQYITDKGLTTLGPLEDLQSIKCAFCSIRGPGLAALAKFKKLRQLSVNFGSTDPNRLQSLAKLQSVCDLSMRVAKLTDTSLAEIGKMGSLESLDIKNNPRVTNAGIKNLSRLKHLTHLNVFGTKVTADGLLALKQLPLREVNFSNEQISAADVKRLQKDFPRVKFDLQKVDDKTEYFKLLAPLK